MYEELGSRARFCHLFRERIIAIIDWNFYFQCYDDETCVKKFETPSYDETRSFGDCYLDASIPNLASVAWPLVQRKGIKKQSPFGNIGYKGYFYARFEGKRVRVFLDKLAPPQAW